MEVNEAFSETAKYLTETAGRVLSMKYSPACDGPVRFLVKPILYDKNVSNVDFHRLAQVYGVDFTILPPFEGCVLNPACEKPSHFGDILCGKIHNWEHCRSFKDLFLPWRL
jgi:hypothetical protein